MGGVLAFDGLAKRFGEVVALDGCTFDVQPGRITGFLGPNGAGKTTTMRAVFGLVQADSGEIRWQGRPIGRTERLRFGYMPEERGVYPKMRVREQLIYFGRLSGLERTRARDAADRWLAQLDLATRADDRVESLSHGNQQRFQLAVALVHDPEVLVLDEPFSGLDPIAVDSMMTLLRERAAADVAVLFSSHQLDLVEDLCEDVVIVDRGRIVLDGPVERLRAASPSRTLELTLRSTRDGWLRGLPGVEVLSVDADTVRMRLSQDVNPTEVIRLAQQAGDLAAVSYRPPDLSELFREVVHR